MFLGIVLRENLPAHGRSLRDVPLSDVVTPARQPGRLGRVGDLGPNDKIAIQSCSRAMTASHRGNRCQISLWQREPPCIHGRFYRLLPWVGHRFTHVLTYAPPLLDRLPNARFVAHGGCWVESPALAGDEIKSQRVSLIASPKRAAPGHRLRHQLIDWADQHGLDLTAFGKEYRPLADKRAALDPFMFSVVIENMQSPGYFTEKLIDCLVCRCLPIYWGAPDISDYFDTRGMIFCESADAIRDAIASLTPEDYVKRLDALEANRRMALRYVDYHQHVFDALRGSSSLCQHGKPPQSLRSNTSAAYSQVG